MSSGAFGIGIAGGTGAGKTTVARQVTARTEDAATLVPLDNYYRDLSHLEFEERREVNYDHPDAFEWERLREDFAKLLDGEPIEMPQYDFGIHNRKDETVRVDPTEVVVLEGILALYDDTITDMLDLKVYVETDADVRILRRIQRDVIERDRDLEGVIDQYLGTVKPMHEQFIEPTKKTADLIIPEGANTEAVELLQQKVQAETADLDDEDWRELVRSGRYDA